MRGGRPIVGALVLGVLAVAGTIGAAARPAEGAARDRPVVTPDEAKAWVDTWWHEREAANAANDVPRARPLVDGTAGEVDLAISRDRNIRRLPGDDTPRVSDTTSVVVPRQTRYPASFLTVIVTVGRHAVPPPDEDPWIRLISLVVVTRASETADWRFSLDTRFVGSEGPNGSRPLDELADLPLAATVDGDGFAAPAPPVDWVRERRLHEDLAEYWQHWRDEKSAPTHLPEFAAGYWTTERGQNIAGNDGRNYKCECTDVASYYTDPRDDVFVFGVADPGFVSGAGDLVCATVRYDVTVTPDDPIPADDEFPLLRQNRSRNNWGGVLRPGWYATITDVHARQVCFLVDPAGPPVRVLAVTTAKVDTWGMRIPRDQVVFRGR